MYYKETLDDRTKNVADEAIEIFSKLNSDDAKMMLFAVKAFSLKQELQELQPCRQFYDTGKR